MKNTYDEFEPEQNNLPSEQPKKTSRIHVRALVKRGAGIALCALLVGGLTFGGVSALGGASSRNVLASQPETSLLLASETETEKPADATGSLDVTDVVETAMPSVVSITSKSLQEVQNYFSLFGYGNYAPETKEVSSAGSGIIVGKNDTELLIATNNHIVEGTEALTITFADNSSYEAALKGTNPDKDLAIVAVPLEDLTDETLSQITVASIGSSDDLKVGEQVVAIGNAMGYGQSVTTGIVSAKNRRYSDNGRGYDTYTDEDKDSDSAVNLIQTDAAINPGNSGGALLNMKGEVVGINSSKMASTAVEGMGYAIAITDVIDDLQTLMNEKTRTKLDEDSHGYMGISVESVYSDSSKDEYSSGARIKALTPDGAADKAGLKEGMIIVEFNGKLVESSQALVDFLNYYEPGEEVELTVLVEKDEDEYDKKTFTVTLDDKEVLNNLPQAEEEEDTEEDADDGKQHFSPEERNSIMDGWDRGVFGAPSGN